MDVRTFCLGVLTMGDASGYEIKKRLEGPFQHFYDASFGSIYPALNRLQDEGLVTCTHEAQSKRPDKKVYALTPEGRLAFIRELSSDPGQDRVRSEFLVLMMFAELLPLRHVSKVIDDRIAALTAIVEQISGQECAESSPSHRFVRGYGLAMYRTAIDYLNENRHLVEGDALMAQVKEDRTNGQAPAVKTAQAAE